MGKLEGGLSERKRPERAVPPLRYSGGVSGGVSMLVNCYLAYAIADSTTLLISFVCEVRHALWFDIDLCTKALMHQCQKPCIDCK